MGTIFEDLESISVSGTPDQESRSEPPVKQLTPIPNFSRKIRPSNGMDGDNGPEARLGSKSSAGNSGPNRPEDLSAYVISYVSGQHKVGSNAGPNRTSTASGNGSVSGSGLIYKGPEPRSVSRLSFESDCISIEGA